MAEELYRILQERSIWVLEFRFRPEMDALIFDTLMEEITAELDRAASGSWVLDLSSVNYLSSAGLGLLVNIRQKLRQSRGKLALCGLSPRLVELFRSCCLERLFLIVPTRAAALKAIGR
jgi:anti-anti-sigma factor